MRRSRKILLLIFVVLLLIQIPFIYRRLELRRLRQTIDRLNAERKSVEPNTKYSEYVGVMHVHSFLGGHSSGTFSDIISAAQANKLNFVVMTEHVEKDFDTAESTLKGLHGGVLFINGNEVSSTDGERVLVVPGTNRVVAKEATTYSELVTAATANGALTIAAYPNELKSVEAKFEALEIYNVYTNARSINPITTCFDVLWSHRTYPDLLFANFYQRPDGAIQKWDQLLSKRRVTATAGNDAHANIGVSLVDSSGKTLMGLQLDPYSTSFHLVRMHVLVPRDKELSATTLLEALRQGHSFIGFDIFGDTTGFRFEAENSGESRVQGDEILLRPGTKLKIQVPLKARIAIHKDGQIVMTEDGVFEKDFELKDKGIYRVEAYLPELGKVGTKPWIISNPIYVK
ncbi:MAG TPA: hypothetical protein VLB68_00790 [Pyrinomonadaceae bacterium]|nr:hypothetical protein [Pyrinomonadaceae bacterium]